MNIIVRENLVDYLGELYEKLEKKYGRHEEYQDYLRGWLECIDEVEQFDSGDVDAQLRIYQQTELHNLWVQRFAKMLQEARYLMINRPHDYLPGSVKDIYGWIEKSGFDIEEIEKYIVDHYEELEKENRDIWSSK